MTKKELVDALAEVPDSYDVISSPTNQLTTMLVCDSREELAITGGDELCIAVATSLCDFRLLFPKPCKVKTQKKTRKSEAQVLKELCLSIVEMLGE